MVRVHGPDARTYLHSQVSQELRDLPSGAARWTFVLEPTGKVDALARITCVDDDTFVVDTDAGWGDALSARLARFKIRVKAEIEPIAWSCVAVRGTDGVDAPDGALVVIAWPGDGIDLIGPGITVPDGLDPLSADDYERLRIEAKWPAMGAEITDATIPGETDVLSAAVSFTKGCYPGQELVERIDSRGGNVARHVRVVRAGSSTPLTIGDELLLDGKPVGQVTSSAGDVALAVVARAAQPGTVVHTSGGPATIER